MDALLTFLLVVVLIFFILRLLFPVIIRLFIRRLTGFNMRSHQHKNQKVAYKKGETTIVSHGEERSEVPKDFGDYTDYEEIKN
jgi:predicted membrane protein